MPKGRPDRKDLLLPDTLKRLRTAAGFRHQVDLATATGYDKKKKKGGLHPETIGHYERGERCPGEGMALYIAQQLISKKEPLADEKFMAAYKHDRPLWDEAKAAAATDQPAILENELPQAATEPVAPLPDVAPLPGEETAELPTATAEEPVHLLLPTSTPPTKQAPPKGGWQRGIVRHSRRLKPVASSQQTEPPPVGAIEQVAPLAFAHIKWKEPRRAGHFSLDMPPFPEQAKLPPMPELPLRKVDRTVEPEPTPEANDPAANGDDNEADWAGTYDIGWRRSNDRRREIARRKRLGLPMREGMKGPRSTVRRKAAVPQRAGALREGEWRPMVSAMSASEVTRLSPRVTDDAVLQALGPVSQALTRDKSADLLVAIGRRPNSIWKVHHFQAVAVLCETRRLEAGQEYPWDEWARGYSHLYEYLAMSIWQSLGNSENTFTPTDQVVQEVLLAFMNDAELMGILGLPVWTIDQKQAHKELDRRFY